MGIGVILLFYIVQSTGGNLAERGVIPIPAGAWVADALFLVLGLFLTSRASREESLPLSGALSRLGGSLVRLVARRAPR